MKTLNARIGLSSLSPDEYLEIIQGEEKPLLIVVEANDTFFEESAEAISIKFKDPDENVVIKGDEDITRLLEELDIQVFRVTLSPTDTEALNEGLLHIEIAFDTQKAALTHAVKIIKAL